MRLTGRKIIALVDGEFEDLELWYPVHRVREEGAEVHLAGEKKGKHTSANTVCPLSLNTASMSSAAPIMMEFWCQAAGPLTNCDVIPKCWSL